MAFFDKLGESLVTAGKDVGHRAKEASEIAKLKMDIKTKEDYVKGQYAAIGAAYYEKHKDEEGLEEAEQFFLIREALEEIERMKTEVLKLQKAVECPACGAKMAAGSAFCSSCGAKINEVNQEE